jgi:CheY-like chemotaxis protein
VNQPASSKRILVIDDQPEIHADFQKILAPAAARPSDGLARLRAAIKGSPDAAAPSPAAPSYLLESAHQGEDGFKKILSAREAGQPYSLAFIDMRMPPGWDGLRTIREIWDKDPEVQIVVCSAYSDHPWSDVDAIADRSDRLLVLKKPFDAVEVKRMASTLTAKWRLAREAAAKRAELEELLAEREELYNLERQKDLLRMKELDSTVRQLTSQTREIADIAGNAAPEPEAGNSPRYSLDSAPTWQGGGIP